ncbi:DUF6884 domain-containing protein [Halovivax cerinus]|uniref:DUF6884 domain-containing protein n=1 Tax=Halovivax cerinus TaxID=1487865 RepID=A0ABD5NPI0_9EURY|nr:DUF6884 domain-containing protein [Halovivax cerinus]
MSSDGAGHVRVEIHKFGRLDEVIEIPPEKIGLYGLLRHVLADARVPKSMPARLALTCDDLVGVQELVGSPDRGLIDTDGCAYGLGYALEAKRAIQAYRDRPPVTLVAVGCSKRKYPSDDPIPAADRYQGGYWTNKREYYETIGDDGRIISAKHGVLKPSDPIGYYETHIEDLDDVPVDHNGRLPSGDDVTTLVDLWALDVHTSLATWIDDVAGGVDPHDVELQVLLGKQYHERLRDRDVFDGLRTRGDLTVSFPFRDAIDYSDGGGIGKQRGWMASEIEAASAPVATDGGDQCAE